MLLTVWFSIFPSSLNVWKVIDFFSCISLSAAALSLKSPAGIFTQVTLPVSQIAEKLEGDTLNAVKLGIPIYNETSDKKFGMSMPRNVLLIRKKYKESFFENNQLSDGVTSSLFTQTSSTTNLTEYTYNNITKLINDCLKDRAAGLGLFAG
jgi:hypothetical protein